MKNLFTALLLTVSMAAMAQPKIIAHRGFHAVEGSYENTLSSLINAQNLGVYGVEFDVHMTSDGELVIHHDNKIADGIYAQKSTYAEISKVTLPGGHKIPTLREWIEQGKKSPSTKLILEMKKHKTPAIETEVCERIIALCREMGVMQQMELISFSYHACKEFVRLAPECCVTYVSSNLNTKCDAATAKKEGFGGLSYNLNVFMNRPSIVDECNRLGLYSTLWMVENEEVTDWAIKHNVTFVSTDFPDVIKRYLESKK